MYQSEPLESYLMIQSDNGIYIISFQGQLKNEADFGHLSHSLKFPAHYEPGDRELPNLGKRRPEVKAFSLLYTLLVPVAPGKKLSVVTVVKIINAVSQH